MNIPIAKTFLNQDEINSVLEPLKSGWLVQGPKVREFENEWKLEPKYNIGNKKEEEQSSESPQV